MLATKPPASDLSVPSIKEEHDAMKMPPPPVPAGNSQPPILELEIKALSTCFKNAVVKTGEIYRFFADTKKLGIQRDAPAPPVSLTASLGREIEKFDQLCDSLDSQILRAISVLQRDLTRHEKRLKDEEQAAIATRTRSKSPSPILDRIALASPEMEMQALAGPTPTNSPPIKGAGLPLGRRPSAISISSLNRPSFPLKLDLSAPSMRFNADDASLFSAGIHSPVTLAPRSARPMDYPHDLMVALASASADNSSSGVDMVDLTTSPTQISQLGTSADKPIELDFNGMDIDMSMDLFGDADDMEDSGDGLFSPIITGPSDKVQDLTKDSNSFLSSLGVGSDTSADDFLASLPDLSGTGAVATPSPATLLASFTSHSDTAPPTDGTQFNMEGFEEFLNPDGTIMDMDELFGPTDDQQPTSAIS